MTCSAVANGVSPILETMYGKYKAAMRVNFEAGFKLLLDEADAYSTRAYLQTHL